MHYWGRKALSFALKVLQWFKFSQSFWQNKSWFITISLHFLVSHEVYSRFFHSFQIYATYEISYIYFNINRSNLIVCQWSDFTYFKHGCRLILFPKMIRLFVGLMFWDLELLKSLLPFWMTTFLPFGRRLATCFWLIQMFLLYIPKWLEYFYASRNILKREFRRKHNNKLHNFKSNLKKKCWQKDSIES